MLLMCHGHQDQRKGLPSFSPRLSMQLQPRTSFEDPLWVHRRRNVGRRPRNILGKKPNMICIKERLDIIKQISTKIDLAASRAILIYFPTRFRPSYESLKYRSSRSRLLVLVLYLQCNPSFPTRFGLRGYIAFVSWFSRLINIQSCQ